MSLPNKSHLRLLGSECRLIVIQDQLQPCPYLPQATARMPLRLPVGTVTAEVTDHLLAMGYRRSGDFVYRTQCPACSECKPTRIDVNRFLPTASFRRVLNRGNSELECELRSPRVDAARVALFNQHRQARGLGDSSQPINTDAYRSFLTDTCCETREWSFWMQGRLVAVSIVDLGATSTSAVYTYFDPTIRRHSLGTYAIGKQIEWARQHGHKFVYLGMFVADNPHLNYKARFKPQQRLIADQWVDFDV